jgi:RNA polymerase sigma factor (sigma-70 family)
LKPYPQGDYFRDFSPFRSVPTIFGPLIRLHGWMEEALGTDGIIIGQNRQITQIIAREQARLRQFIRRNVFDDADAEDIFQEVFYELLEAYRLVKPVEQVGAWLFRVARNRIIDLFRSKRSLVLGNDSGTEDGDVHQWEDLLPSPDAGPEAAYLRRVLLEELDAAIEDLPDGQRDVFVAHEIEGRSFRELSDETGLSVNTLLSRKRYAVLRLRHRLQAIFDEFERE